jgi:hypothetical protein
LSCDDEYDSDSTGVSYAKRKSQLEEFKEEFKFVRKHSTKSFCNEFENLYKESGFMLEDTKTELFVDFSNADKPRKSIIERLQSRTG